MNSRLINTTPRLMSLLRILRTLCA